MERKLQAPRQRNGVMSIYYRLLVRRKCGRPELHICVVVMHARKSQKTQTTPIVTPGCTKLSVPSCFLNHYPTAWSVTGKQYTFEKILPGMFPNQNWLCTSTPQVLFRGIPLATT